MTASMPAGIVRKRCSGCPGRTRVNGKQNGQELGGAPGYQSGDIGTTWLLKDFRLFERGARLVSPVKILEMAI
jgi:hypothetical protein